MTPQTAYFIVRETPRGRLLKVTRKARTAYACLTLRDKKYPQLMAAPQSVIDKRNLK